MAHFVRSFDCNVESQVMWLKDVGEAMAKAIGGEKLNILTIVNKNPLPGSPAMENPIDWAYTHFQLCMKYTNAVLQCDAFVPKK